jgi:hypothetical protein
MLEDWHIKLHSLAKDIVNYVNNGDKERAVNELKNIEFISDNVIHYIENIEKLMIRKRISN